MCTLISVYVNVVQLLKVTYVNTILIMTYVNFLTTVLQRLVAIIVATSVAISCYCRRCRRRD